MRTTRQPVAPRQARKCETCKKEAVKHERFCSDCRKVQLAEIRASGFLAHVPANLARYRDRNMRENTHETKHGTYYDGE